MAPSPWRIDPTVTFLNHGSFGSCPTPVLEAQAEFRERMESDPVRFLDRELLGLLDATRAEVGRFIGADPEGIAFVPNATTGVNTVLKSLRFEPGDELLTTDHEYNAILNTVREVARRDQANVAIAAIPFPLRDPAEAVQAILDVVTPHTRIAVLSHITSPTGIVLPIADIVHELEGRGIATIVDAAHAPGMVPLDVDGLGASYWVGNGHKWLCAPKGASILWVRATLRDRIHPLVTSHGANDPGTERSRFRAEFDWPGTVDPTPFLSLPAAIRFGAGLLPGGWPALMAANHDLAIRGRDLLCDRLAVEPPAPDEMVGAMATVQLNLPLDDDAVAAFRDLLAEEDRIEVPMVAWPVPAAREGGRGGQPKSTWVRISMQQYNTLADVERLADALVRRLPARGGQR
jgi:isopenicillin-N epimerase